MSRKARNFKEGAYYYVETRSFNDRAVFRVDADYDQYMRFFKKYKLRFRISVYAYCFMPAMTCLVVYPGDARVLSSFMQCMNQAYARYFNNENNTTGKVWGQRFKSTVIDNEYDLLRSIKLVEFIPVSEKLVLSPFEYQWSSCRQRIVGLRGVVDPIPVRKVKLSDILIYKEQMF